jgi:hypothetical protein
MSGVLQLLMGDNGAAAAAYVGPGDVIAGAGAWYGLRAYSAAKAGTKAVKLIRSSDSTQQDINTLANGNLDVGDAFFDGSTTYKVVTLYDQSGSTLGTGGVACDITQSNDTLRPVFTLSGIGSLPCMTWTSAMKLVGPGLTSSHAQPFCSSCVAKRTGNNTSRGDIMFNDPSALIIVGFKDATNTVYCIDGTEQTATAADNSLHAIQVLMSGASSSFYIDGSSTAAASLGTTGIGFQAFGMGTVFNGLTGISTESGWWLSDISSSFAGLNSNQHTYWGF